MEMQARDTMGSMRTRTPMKYAVFSRDRLQDILTMNLAISTIDKIKFAVMAELLYEGCTMNDMALVFEIYAIDYHARRAMIDIKQSIMNTHELPDEVSFVTCRVGVIANCWDRHGDD